MMAGPVGENQWLSLLDDTGKHASDLDQRIEVVELYKKAIAAEPWSTKMWLAYCEWIWSLYTDCRTVNAEWSEEEQQLGQELFSLDMALGVWQEGAEATQWRLNDSNVVWDRWASKELEMLSNSVDQSGIERLRQMFFERLRVPHASWDQTSQMFSTFVTRYDEAAWETTMVQTTQIAKLAKDLYSQREFQEISVQRAHNSGDKQAECMDMREYLDWEREQTYKKPKRGHSKPPVILLVALYERALVSTDLGLAANIWEDYVVFLLTSVGKEGIEPARHRVISAAQRATVHCPWSGSLWARYMLIAETEQQTFSAIEQIRQSAISSGVLDRDGLEAVMEVNIAWCGYLKRRTMLEAATGECFDIADKNLPAAIESVQKWGQRLYGAREFKGDPLFRMEQIYIQYCTERGEIEQARALWNKLIDSHGDGYEFWQQYYLWEMVVGESSKSRAHATTVLNQAVRHKGLDWPEKMMEVYLRHCHNYADVQEIVSAKNITYTQAKGVAKRRLKEAAEAAAAYAHQVSTMEDRPAGSPAGASKRKREDSEELLQNFNKKVKNEKSTPEADELQGSDLKRDRENTTVLVTNLPPDTTKLRLRQFFKAYGDIYKVTLHSEADETSASALIEFRCHEDVQSALLRDGKSFDENPIHVEVGTGLTIYVTNYPPTADEAYMRRLFEPCGKIFSIRFPSLKYNTQRRFCYISFKSTAAAAEATKLDGKQIEGHFRLVAKYSDPQGKKAREGATAEGRELHVSGIDPSLTEDEIKQVFGKYGNIEKIKLLKTMTGSSKGAAFITFGSTEDAESALNLDKTKLKAKILKVEIAATKNFKPIATVIGSTQSASPVPDADGKSVASPSLDVQLNTHALYPPHKPDTTDRTVTVMNIPDTVNDARIRAIAEPYGNITKLVLRPDHQGAIIEYAEVASAGRASLGLENYEIQPGRKLRTGGMKDLFELKGEVKTDKIEIGQGKKQPARFIQPGGPVKRPGGRGGLGRKSGLGYIANTPRLATGAAGAAIGANEQGNSDGNKRAKSNADFRAMLTGTK